MVYSIWKRSEERGASLKDDRVCDSESVKPQSGADNDTTTDFLSTTHNKMLRVNKMGDSNHAKMKTSSHHRNNIIPYINSTTKIILWSRAIITVKSLRVCTKKATHGALVADGESDCGFNSSN